MRRLLWVLGALVALLVAAFAAAVWLLDAEALRKPLAAAASDALGRDVQLGAMRVAIFPLPSVEVGELRVAGAAQGDPPFAEVDALRLRVALWPLLGGQVIVRALELERPRVFVPVDEKGAPVLPGRTRAPSAPDPRERAEPAKDGKAPPALAVQRIAVRDAELRFGEWTASGLRADGSLGLDGTGRIELRTDLAGPATARGAHLDADFALADGRLAGLDAKLAAGDVAYASGGTELRGPVKGALRLGGPWNLALSEASLRVPGAIDKRAGVPLVLSGQLGPQLDPSALGEVEVQLGRARVQIQPELPRRVSARGRIAIQDLQGVLDRALPLRGGGIELERFGVELDGTKLFGRAILDRLAVEGPRGPIEISGTAVARGKRIRLEDGTALVGGERVAVAGTYDLASQTLEVQTSTDKAKLGPLLSAFTEGAPIEGTLGSSAAIELRGGIESLRGQGRIQVQPGQIRGFSLMRQVLGDLAALPGLVAALRGKDLSRYQQEEFEELSADFRVDGGRVTTDNLVLRYRHGTATLHGSMGLVDRALDLRGRIELSREVDAELGKTRGSPTVIPIAHIGGTLDAPRVRLDRETLAQVALAYTAQGRVREKLEEKLGPGGAEAVEDILDRLRRKRDEK